MSAGLPQGVALASLAAPMATCGGIALLRPGSWASAVALVLSGPDDG